MNYKHTFAVLFLMLVSGSATANEPIDFGWEPSLVDINPARETVGHYSMSGFDPVTRDMKQLDLFQNLQSAQSGSQNPPGFRIEISAQNRIDLGHNPGEVSRQQKQERRYQVGVTRAVNSRVNFSQASLRSARGKSVDHQKGLLSQHGGQFVWSAPAHSNDAVAMRVFFSAVNIADGAGLFVYNDAGQAFGPFTGNGPNDDGEFWSQTLAGSVIKIQLQGTGIALANSSFVVDELAHIGPRFLLADRLAPNPLADPTSSNCGTTAACVTDGSCFDSDDWPAIEDARNSVASIEFVDRGWVYLCSGGLLADDDESSEVPLFLTANHCISRGKAAKSLDTFWFYQTSECGKCGDTHFDQGPGRASILATSRTGDFTLLELSSSPPEGTVFAGTSNAPVADDHGQPLYRVSHPHGVPQAYSEHRVDTATGTCSIWPRGSWIYSRDVIGATQGGSSGSPVFNQAGQVVGQLSGGCGTNINDDCDSVENATVDGALASYYSAVEPFLSPDTSCVSEPEVCDGIDNNCDGDIDEGCGGGGLLPSGASCKKHNQCESGTCSGRGRNKVCE